MLALRIIATVLVSISVITGIVKDVGTIETNDTALLFAMLWSILWRAFVIVALWVI